MLDPPSEMNMHEARLFFVVHLQRDDQSNRLTDYFLRRIAEQPTGATIPRQDDPIDALTDDGIVGGFHDCGEKRLISFCPFPSDLPLGPFVKLCIIDGDSSVSGHPNGKSLCLFAEHSGLWMAEE